MEDKILDWEKSIIRFMQRYNRFSIPLADQKMKDKGFEEVICGNEDVYLLHYSGYVSYYCTRSLTEAEKEGIYKYVIWYCNNMIER
jgi:hypothetical protein